MRIGIDAMGGDRAPGEVVRGALSAREFLNGDDRIVLIGDETAIARELGEANDWREFIEIRHAPQAIAMDEKPVEALRTKPDSSIAVMAAMHRAGELDGCISAGNTGAFVAAAQMRLRRLRGVHRPGICVVAPTFRGPVAVCDVGANVNCRPLHLHQYAVMASIYAGAIFGADNPRVALLSIGAEDAKGNELTKGAHQLLKDDPDIRFVGNVEGRDLFRGVCDVMICEGFVGNVVLKLVEGMAESVVTGMLQEISRAMPQHVAEIRKAAKRIVHKYDYNEYGGAPLLGVAGICIICHGSSSYRGIMNAVRAVVDFSKRQVNERIVRSLSRDE